MACSCSRNSCSSGCCNGSWARVSCANRSGCSSCGWNGWNGWNWGRSSCSTCGCSGCSSCNSCSSCNTCSSCNSCNNCNSCGCSSCCDTWNSGRSGCGISNRFGLLKGVSGPYNCIIDGRRFPFYTGPCGPCACDCCCNNGCNDCCDTCCSDGCDTCCDDCYSDCSDTCCDTCGCSNATFTASTPVELASGDAVELECTSELNHDFTVTQDGIRIHRAGNYMVVYTVHVPANEAVSSRFILTLNGDRIAASAADVTSLADGSTNGYTMHASIFVPENSLLKLVSLSPVSICQGPASNVFTLSLHRMN